MIHFGYDAIAQAYKEDPEESAQIIFARIREEYPWVTDEQIRKVLK